MARSIFERNGGFARISRIVMSFYEKMTTSPLTKKYFEKVDMKRLIDHQTKFVSSMMGGPASFTDEHLERVHANLGITTAAFDESVDLFEETLEDHDFADDDIGEVKREVLRHRKIIVTKE
jgi:hemoglobin